MNKKQYWQMSLSELVEESSAQLLEDIQKNDSLVPEVDAEFEKYGGKITYAEALKRVRSRQIGQESRAEVKAEREKRIAELRGRK